MCAVTDAQKAEIDAQIANYRSLINDYEAEKTENTDVCETARCIVESFSQLSTALSQVSVNGGVPFDHGNLFSNYGTCDDAVKLFEDEIANREKRLEEIESNIRDLQDKIVASINERKSIGDSCGRCYQCNPPSIDEQIRLGIA